MKTDEKIELEAFSFEWLIDREVFAKIWNGLLDARLGMKKYSRSQPYKHVMTSDVEVAYKEFNKDRYLMLTNKAGISASIGWHLHHGISVWRLFVDAKRWKPDLYAWFEELATNVPVFFARASSMAEYSAKHRVVDTFAQGRSLSAVGASLPELQQFLPGIYWRTILGAEITGHLAIDAARTDPDATVRDLASGQVAIDIQRDPFATGDGFDELQRIEKRVATLLGDDYFFDRDRPRSLKQVPAIVARLAQRRQEALAQHVQLT